MLNYIAAELYKLRHKKGLYIGTGLLIVLELSVILPQIGTDIEAKMAYLFLTVFLPVGLFIAPILTALVFDDQYGHGTLKNEVIYGIPRSRIYLGKLAAAILAGTVIAAAAVAGYLGLSTLILGPIGAADKEALSATVQAAFCAYPLWLGCLSFTFFLLTAVKSAAGAMAIAFSTTIFGTPLALVASQMKDSPLVFRLGTFFYAGPFQVIYGNAGARLGFLEAHAALYCWLLGLAWVVGASALGMLVLRRREIR